MAELDRATAAIGEMRTGSIAADARHGNGDAGARAHRPAQCGLLIQPGRYAMANSGTQTVPKDQALEPVMSWLTNVTEPAPPDPVIDAQADEVVGKLLTVNPAEADKIAINKQAIENLGAELQKRSRAAQRDAEAAGAQAVRGRDRGRRGRQRAGRPQDEGRGARSRPVRLRAGLDRRACSGSCRSWARRSSATSAATRSSSTAARRDRARAAGSARRARAATTSRSPTTRRRCARWPRSSRRRSSSAS